MKKSLLLTAILGFMIIYPVKPQGLLNKVKKAVSKEISEITGEDNSKKSSKPGPEPACACDDAKLIVELGGGLNLEYSEISITMNDDGSILLKDRINSKYYIAKDGNTQGPFDADDPRVKAFEIENAERFKEDKKADWSTRYPDFISRSGEKYLIKHNGKSYGPYALIGDFTITKSKEKFAAIVTENVIMTEEEGKKMEEALKNAKTDQERMELSMAYSQQISQKMLQDGGASSIQPKIISNMPVATFDPVNLMGARLNNKVKLDDILVIAVDKILDLQGSTVMKLTESSYNSSAMFVSSSNDRYATYNYGKLTFSDNTSLSELFNPYLLNTGGKVYLTYMYYSPGKNAIMQCAVPF